MKNRLYATLFAVAALGAALSLAGCGSSSPADREPTKDDFGKKPKPAGYVGPGQPGGPTTGPVGGGTPPPMGKAGGG